MFSDLHKSQERLVLVGWWPLERVPFYLYWRVHSPKRLPLGFRLVVVESCCLQVDSVDFDFGFEIVDQTVLLILCLHHSKVK
jgi:hypothetical protein